MCVCVPQSHKPAFAGRCGSEQRGVEVRRGGEGEGGGTRETSRAGPGGAEVGMQSGSKEEIERGGGTKRV